MPLPNCLNCFDLVLWGREISSLSHRCPGRSTPLTSPTWTRQQSCSSGWDSACVGHRYSKPGGIAGGARLGGGDRQEFNGLLRDPEVRAIIAHDGGQTAFGYLDLIDVEAIMADPKPILGYSDISLLHLVLYARTGLVGFHTDVATPGLGGHWQAAPAARQAELEKLYSTLLTGTEPIGALPASPSWECWRTGRAEGRLIGGLINRLVLNQATCYALPLDRFDGAVLFWEESGGHASHVWSYLQVLRHAGCPRTHRRHGRGHPDRDRWTRFARRVPDPARDSSRCPRRP